MKIFVYLFASVLSLSSCAKTSIKTPKFTMDTQANMKGLDVKADGSIHVDELDSAAGTLAGGQAVSAGATALGIGISTSGILKAVTLIH